MTRSRSNIEMDAIILKMLGKGRSRAEIMVALRLTQNSLSYRLKRLGKVDPKRVEIGKRNARPFKSKSASTLQGEK